MSMAEGLYNRDKTAILNSEQQAAVAHTDGPLVVTAGPGSGKTFVIVEKVLKLVESGMSPSAVLCLTCTEKAAGEMKQRLEKAGILDAKIYTFHSFAKEVLEDNFMESGLGRPTKILTRPSQMVWCIRNTERFNFDPKYLEVGHNQVDVCSSILETIGNCNERDKEE